MVKSRRKKNEKKDFQKVKFKVGKKLPKADNVTNVSFQSKGINIKEQLKTDAAQPSNKRKQNINDLLSQTQHYNATFRHDSLTGLKELITMHPEVGQHHLSSIIEKVSALFVDKDGVIRQTVLKVFNVLFPNTSANALAPFFSVINAHLCCAMTHIDDQIQADSLSVVDVLLKFYPNELIEHCSQLLPNFINLISRQTSKSGTAGTRTLSVNPSNKVHAQKWRMKVLERLYNFLVALSRSVEVRNQSNNAPEKSVTVDCIGQNIFYQPKAPLIHPIPFCNGFQLRPQQHVNQLSHQDVLNHPEQLKKFVTTLMPLLLDCWVECSPAQLVADIPSNSPPVETMAMMQSIIKVVQLLWQCVEGLASEDEEITLSWLANTYMNEFVHHFMAYFPYSGREVLERNKRSKKVEIKQVSMMSLNLRVCDIMVYFLQEKLPEVLHSHWVHNLMDFIIAVAEGSRLPAEEGQLLLEIFRRLLSVEFSEGSKLLADLLEAAWSMYKRSHPSSAERQNLLKLILEDILPRRHYISYPVMQEWLASLPEFLLGCKLDNDVTVNLILEAMGKVASQKHINFNRSFEKYLDGILDPENSILLKLHPGQQRKLVEILHSVSVFDTCDFSNLLACCRSERFDITNVGYLLQILHHKYQRHSRQFCEASAYLSFMLSLGAGTGCPTDNPVHEKIPLCSMTASDVGWERQQVLTKMVYELLNLWPNSGQVWAVAFSYIMKFKKAYTNIPLSSATAILQLVKNLYRPGATDENHVCREVSELMVMAAMTIAVLKEGGKVSQKEGCSVYQMDVDVANNQSQDATLVDDRKLSSVQIKDVHTLLEEVLNVVPRLVETCVEQISSLLQGHPPPEQRSYILSSLVNLLKPDSVKTCVINKKHFQAVSNQILGSHSAADEALYSKQIAALKYELTLFS